MRKQFVMLDFYRFLAASGVVVYHFAAYNPGTALHGLVTEFGLFVDFFFILSGFVIAYVYADNVSTAAGVATFLRRRIARVYPLHFATLMFYVIPVAILTLAHRPIPNPEKYSLSFVPYQLTMTQSWFGNGALTFNHPAWSISVEWAMYLAFPLLIWFRRLAGGWVILAAVVLGGAALGMFGDWESTAPLRAAPTFAIGVLIAMTFDRVKISGAFWLGVSAFLAAVVLMVWGANLLGILVLFALSVFLTANGQQQGQGTLFERKGFKLLGESSYSIYMLHTPILAIFINGIWSHLFGTSPQIPIAYGVTLYFLIFVLSLLTFTYFENPMRIFLSGSSYARLARRAS